MVAKIYKIILLCSIVFYQNISFSKSFNQNNAYNYFSALVSLDAGQNKKSLKFFNSSKLLKESHQSYIKKYLFSLILNEKINRAIKEIKTIENKKFTDFFEAQLLLLLDSLKKHDFKKSLIYINNLKKHEEEGTFEFLISNILKEYVFLFNNNVIYNNSEDNFGKLSLINKTLQNCYLKNPNTESYFLNLINSGDLGYSRYSFFYLNYLLNQNSFTKAQNLSKSIIPLNSTLLVAQSKKWMDEENFEKIKEIFSCQNSNDIIGELFFVISNLYSSEGDLKKSNYYFNLSNYFNPKFKFNLSLLAENYLKNNKFEKSKQILNKFKKENEIYYWYKIKKTAQIISKNNGPEQTFNYINAEFNKIKNPSAKMILDMANIVKGLKKYDLSILYYSKVLNRLNEKSLIYADVLYERGSSYERLGKNKKSDEDLLKSLEINPDEPHVLNYLAYSWLERNYNIDEAIQMLEKAYKNKQNDPYIIDSIGWAYYLVGEYDGAERLLRRAIEIMPRDPIVNDHYGDILWKLDRKIQAIYFWNNVLNFEETEDEMKEEIFYKLLKGPKKI